MADVEMSPAAGLKRKEEDTKVLSPSNGAAPRKDPLCWAAAAPARARRAPAPPCARRVLRCTGIDATGATIAPDRAGARLRRRRSRCLPFGAPLISCPAALCAGDAPAKKAKGGDGAAGGGKKGAKKAVEDTPPVDGAAAVAAPRSGRAAAQGVRYSDMEASADEALRRPKADLYVAPKEEAAAVTEAQALEQTHGSAGCRRIFDFKGAPLPQAALQQRWLCLACA